MFSFECATAVSEEINAMVNHPLELGRGGPWTQIAGRRFWMLNVRFFVGVRKIGCKLSCENVLLKKYILRLWGNATG